MLEVVVTSQSRKRGRTTERGRSLRIMIIVGVIFVILVTINDVVLHNDLDACMQLSTFCWNTARCLHKTVEGASTVCHRTVHNFSCNFNDVIIVDAEPSHFTIILEQ